MRHASLRAWPYARMAAAAAHPSAAPRQGKWIEWFGVILAAALILAALAS